MIAESHRLDQLVQDLVRDRLVKVPFVAERPEIQLERLELQAEGVRHVANADDGEVGLSRPRAEAG